MATNHMSEVLQHLRRMVLVPDGAGLSDGQLLSRYLEGRDEDAFAALVQRHGPLVWGVCRRLLPNHQDAEDAFQATFLVLVRKATTVLPREMVANWLYGVAYMTAHRAKVAAAKARRREGQFVNMPEPAVVESDLWTDLRPLLDQELTRLPDLYRVVVVLCDLEGKTRKEAARRLGLPEGTVASRLARARVMLAKRLARHGLGVSGAALATLLSPQAASAGVPCSVVSFTIKAASLLAAGQAAATGLVSAKVAALTEGVLKAMLMSKLKSVIAVTLAVVATVGIGAGTLGYGAAARGPNEGKKAAAVAPQREVATSDEEGSSQKDAAQKDKETLQGRWVAVSAEAGGRPVPKEKVQKAHVTLVISGNEFTATASGAFTNEVGLKGDATWKGIIQIDPTKQPGWFDLVDCRLDAGKAQDVKTSGTKGIYELQGDTLKVCYGPERPTEFQTKSYSYVKLYVFKRETQKEDKGDNKGEDQGASKENGAKADSQRRRDEYLALITEFKKAEEHSYQSFDKAIAEAKTEETKKKAYQLAQDLYPDRLKYARRLLDLAKADPAAPLTVDVLFWICTHRLGSPAYHELEGQALQLVVKHQLESKKAVERLPWLCAACGDGMTGEREAFLRAVLEKSKRREIRAAGAYYLGIYLMNEANWVTRLQIFPSQVTFMDHVQGKSRTKELQAKEPRELLKAAEKFFQLVKDDYGDVTFWSRSVQERVGGMIDALFGKNAANSTTYGKMAAVQLHELHDLTLGRQAPEIEGEDLDGHKFKLSDYRGKVVAVSFWATWCPPCMRLIDQERLLLKRYTGKSFVLLGVNGDASKQAEKDAVTKHQISWRSWFDGQDGPIAKQWNVDAWPTVIVIDRQGVIRLRDSDPQFLNEAIERLLKEAPKK